MDFPGGPYHRRPPVGCRLDPGGTHRGPKPNRRHTVFARGEPARKPRDPTNNNWVRCCGDNRSSARSHVEQLTDKATAHLHRLKEVSRRTTKDIGYLFQPGPALSTETGACRAFRSARLTCNQREVRSAVAAELPFSSRLAALRTDGLLVLDLSCENLGLTGLLTNIRDHLLSPCRGNLRASPGSVLHA